MQDGGKATDVRGGGEQQKAGLLLLQSELLGFLVILYFYLGHEAMTLSKPVN